jgi:2-polyprenyl-6-methoxyphenol hydroxylase-like FAD-dependent oxidoreductase
MDYDCVVIGGGVVGLLAAHLLAQDKKRVIVFEAQKPDFQDRRFFGLTYGSIRRLESFGIQLPIHHKIEELFFEVDKKVSNTLKYKDLHLPFLGMNISHALLLLSIKNQLHSNVELVHDKVIDVKKMMHWSIQTVTGRSIESRLLIAADGFHSIVRQQYAPKFLYHDRYEQSALVLKVFKLNSSMSQAYQLGLNKILVGVLPLDFDAYYVVISGPNFMINEFFADLHGRLVHFLTTLFPRALLPFERIEYLAGPIPLQSYCVEKQVQSDLILLGLAAKSFHPAAAMGMNQNIFELSVFGQLLKRYPGVEDFLWTSLFQQSIFTRSQQIRWLTTLLACSSARQIIHALPFSMPCLYPHLARFVG